MIKKNKMTTTTTSNDNESLIMKLKRKNNATTNNEIIKNKRIRRNSCGSTDSNYSTESSSSQHQEQPEPLEILNKVIYKDSSTSVDQELLGPCKSGSPIQLEGIVWSETSHGVLVLNVTWKGKTFLGALMDSTNNQWAPPMFNNNKLIINDNKSSSSSLCTLLDEDEQFLMNQDPSIRILRNGKRRYLNLSNKSLNVVNNNKKSNKDKK